MVILKKHSRSGSALLIVLLIASVAGITALIAAQASISNLRLVGSTSAKQSAYLAAHAGIEEGLKRYKDGIGLVKGEYGKFNAPGGSYSLTHKYRTMCEGGGISEVASLSGDCPSYSLEVRRARQVGSSTSFRYTAKEFPVGVTNSLYFYKAQCPATVTFVFRNPPPAGVSAFKHSLSTVPEDPANPGVGNTLSINECDKVLNLKLERDLHESGFTITANGSSMIIDKGYTTITSTGYAAGPNSEQVTLEATVHKDNSADKLHIQIIPVFHTYDTTGNHNSS